MNNEEDTKKKRGRPIGSVKKPPSSDAISKPVMQEMRRLEAAHENQFGGNKKRKPLTVDMKHAISDCFGHLGGLVGFAEWATHNRTLFYTQFCTKMVPKDITFDAKVSQGDGDMDVSQKVLSMLSMEQLERLEQMTIDAKPITPQPGEDQQCTTDIQPTSLILEAAMTEVLNGIESESDQEPLPPDLELLPTND